MAHATERICCCQADVTKALVIGPSSVAGQQHTHHGLGAITATTLLLQNASQCTTGPAARHHYRCLSQLAASCQYW